MRLIVFILFVFILQACDSPNDQDQGSILITGNTIAVNGDSIQVSVMEGVSALDTQEFYQAIRLAHPKPAQRTLEVLLESESSLEPLSWDFQNREETHGGVLNLNLSDDQNKGNAWQLHGEEYWSSLLEGSLFFNGDNSLELLDAEKLMSDSMTLVFQIFPLQWSDATPVTLFYTKEPSENQTLFAMFIDKNGRLSFGYAGESETKGVLGGEWLQVNQWHEVQIRFVPGFLEIWLNQKRIASALLPQGRNKTKQNMYLGQTFVDNTPTIEGAFHGIIDYVLLGKGAHISAKEIAVATEVNCSASPEKCPEITDARDGQKYPTVIIGNQQWMAANLNFGTKVDAGIMQQKSEKFCLDNNVANCDQIGGGGFYQWHTVMNLPDSCTQVLCGTQIELNHQGICPEGWWVPGDEDWKNLERALVIVEEQVSEHVESTDRGGSNLSQKLRSTSGWSSTVGNGNDSYGLNFQGNGIYKWENKAFEYQGDEAAYWSKLQPGPLWPQSRILISTGLLKTNVVKKEDAINVRCYRELE